MMRLPWKTAASAFLVLPVVWSIQGCARVGPRSHPAAVERPPQVESTRPLRTEVPPEGQRSVSVPPGSPPFRSAPSPARTQTGPYVHVVRWEGETLSLIAHWYSGSWENWKALAKANPGLDPDRITVGERIRIPRSLLKKNTPMPFDFVHPSAGRTQKKKPARRPAAVTGESKRIRPTAAAERHAPAEEKIELFKPSEVPEEEPGLFEPIE